MQGKLDGLSRKRWLTDEELIREHAERVRIGRRRDRLAAALLCDLVVATDGPCAVACEPEKLIAFIPNGSCATFLCDVEDGSQWRTGGCTR